MAQVVGAPDSFRVRQGDWRAIYSVEDGDVIVERVGTAKRSIDEHAMAEAGRRDQRCGALE